MVILPANNVLGPCVLTVKVLLFRDKCLVSELILRFV